MNRRDRSIRVTWGWGGTQTGKAEGCWKCSQSRSGRELWERTHLESIIELHTWCTLCTLYLSKNKWIGVRQERRGKYSRQRTEHVQKPCGSSEWDMYQGLEKASMVGGGRVSWSVVQDEGRRGAGPGQPQAAFLVLRASAYCCALFSMWGGVVVEGICLDLLCGQRLREARMSSTGFAADPVKMTTSWVGMVVKKGSRSL